MIKKYTIQEVNDITKIVFIQDPTFDDAKEVIDRLVEENSYPLRLWDFGSVLFSFTRDEIQAIAMYGKSKFLEENRIAVVAPQDVAYGMLRTFEVYRDQESHSVVRAFRNTQEAMDWLEQQKQELDSAIHSEDQRWTGE